MSTHPDPIHASHSELEAALPHLRASPVDRGTLQLIVRRPANLARETLVEAELTTEEGLVGDNWRLRGSRHTPDGSANPNQQLTLMNARAVALVARTRDRWALAGDQLFVDLDLSETNLPAGTRLSIGTAIVEISAHPHTGCAKFLERFGADALKFFNSPQGRALRLRGLNARVLQPGSVRTGDLVLKLP